MSAATASKDILGTGRRKTAVARVRVRPGSGKITINGRELTDYFPFERDQATAISPLRQSGQAEAVDVSVRLDGGGLPSQAGAMKLGIARALIKMDTEFEAGLRHAGMLTRDGRMKERKKYGLRGARRGTQFSKR
jgi:small subunit ribosomal protein S9